MKIESLNILNYRNIAECELRFSPKFNCFLGDNGMGKTNLLDSIYYLAITKSHLNAIDSQLVRHGEPFMMLHGEVSERDNETCSRDSIDVTIKPHTKKLFKMNGKAYTKMADHIGKIPVVLVSPMDQSLIAEGSDERRRFMDIVISQCDTRYINSLMRYNTVLKNRNEMLKKLGEEGGDDSLLDIYNQQMEIEAEYIYQKREAFIEKFIPLFNTFYNEICSEREQVELRYESHLNSGKALSELLQEVKARDIILGFTTRGIHKDDLLMTIGGYPMKGTGSQGQSKSFVVAMKLAQYMFLTAESGKKPLLLLDDVFDRLDATRVENIIRIVSSEEFGQIFITDTSRNKVDGLLEGREAEIFSIKEGAIENSSHKVK